MIKERIHSLSEISLNANNFVILFLIPVNAFIYLLLNTIHEKMISPFHKMIPFINIIIDLLNIKKQFWK